MRLGKKLVLDTSVLVEHIVARSPLQGPRRKHFRRAARGELELNVNAVTLAETLYVASRIYSTAGVEDPNGEARNFVTWVTRRADVLDIDIHTSTLAGELKKEAKDSAPGLIAVRISVYVGVHFV
ncbi:type II toxin-antitoxin system VapC family toxin [Thermoproteus tenax]|uniref:Predicted nucleic acid-binding protein, contains PIN domain n=1 Tax=Thermoproteus tenax (strain ATCC 35583 / DSM 2078 / JCM 9277 / NBRC 100435 / Kra 1) TaxID=768679 RepID=G4RJR7_THETK|nr:PIN domain-containing protein [Thermoproteus tenax]CCC81812.1 predicted nucleic acid-binding protein, contains PIN domain [Thermoproteus tenax Kra 1]